MSGVFLERFIVFLPKRRNFCSTVRRSCRNRNRHIRHEHLLLRSQRRVNAEHRQPNREPALDGCPGLAFPSRYLSVKVADKDFIDGAATRRVDAKQNHAVVWRSINEWRQSAAKPSDIQRYRSGNPDFRHRSYQSRFVHPLNDCWTDLSWQIPEVETDVG